METLIAEILMQQNKYQGTYKCRVYCVERTDFPVYPHIGADEVIVLSDDRHAYILKRDGSSRPLEVSFRREESNRQYVCDIVLSATQASRGKAACKINQHLATIRDDRRIDSRDVYPKQQ